MSIANRILVLILVPLVTFLGLWGLIVGKLISSLTEMDQLTIGGAIIQPLDGLAPDARSTAISELVITTSLVLGVIAGLSALGFLTMRSISKPITALAQAIRALAGASLKREAETKAQMGLDENLTALRDALYAHGKPRRESDKLYFGAFLANGANEVVDQIKSRFGGTATISSAPFASPRMSCKRMDRVRSGRRSRRDPPAKPRSSTPRCIRAKHGFSASHT